MSFIETPRFPEHVSAGSSSTPQWSTAITALAGGAEQRNKNWSYPRFRYDVSFGIKDIGDMYDVYEYFIAVGGPANGFRYKDYLDHNSTDYGGTVTALDQSLATGDGATKTFQIYKWYVKGALQMARPIKKPVSGTVLLAVNGTPTTSGWTVNTTTGVITFTDAPANGAVLTVGFEFDVPVRFESDELQISFPDVGVAAGTINLLSLPYE